MKYNIFLRLWTYIQSQFLRKSFSIGEGSTTAFHFSCSNASFLYDKKERRTDRRKKQKQKQGRDQGVVTVAFLLVLIIVMSFILYFFQICLALTHVSITQYISYSTARKFYLGDAMETEQYGEAYKHYEKLRERFFGSKYKNLSGNEWFYISPELDAPDVLLRFGEGGTALPFPNDSSVSAGRRKMFYGVGIGFFPRLLDIEIPFLTNPSSASAVEVYTIMSFLGREPSKDECTRFFKNDNGGPDREKKIKQKYSNLPNIADGIFPDSGDNGC